VRYKNGLIVGTLVALLLSCLPSSLAATAVIKPNITSVDVLGEVATIKWSSPKLPAKAYFEVEIKTRTTPAVTTVTRSTTLVIAKVWNPIRSTASALDLWQ